MKPLDVFLSVPNSSKPAADLVSAKKTVNLNSLIASAVRQTEWAAGTVILRMDELPEILANPHQLQEAFCLLVRFMLAQAPGASKVYCYVKGAAIGPSLLDEREEARAFGVEIHSNAEDPTYGREQPMLQQAARFFASNKIGFEHKKVPAGGMLFSLILYGCAPPAGNSAGQ